LLQTLFLTASIFTELFVTNFWPSTVVLNAAVRLVVKKRKWVSITPTIRDDLHWLLVWQHIQFKICLLVYKCLHQLVAPYLVSMISPVSAVSTSRRHLRSAGQGDLVGCAMDKNSWPQSTKLFSRWSVSVEQSATGN